MPISGAAVPGMAAYDKAIPDLMRKYAIPGGAVAVLRDGKLIYARGFGYADVENRTPVQPDALFRIASVSKPITGVAIMKLVEEGKLELDDRVAPFIARLAPAPGATVDPRYLVARRIAARHDEHSRALASRLLVGRAVQRPERDRQVRRRTRCRAIGRACERHVIPDARPVLGLPVT